MGLRLTSTNRKDYKTEETIDSHSFPFLIWKVYPKDKDLRNTPTALVEGVRVWLAGTSMSEKWYVKQKHLPGETSFPEGGYTLVSPQEGITYASYEEVILHPSAGKKPKPIKTNEKPSNTKTKTTRRKRG